MVHFEDDENLRMSEIFKEKRRSNREDQI